MQKCTERIQYKVVLLGDAAAGKSSFLNRASEGLYQNWLHPTAGFSTRSIHINLPDGSNVILTFWDIGGGTSASSSLLSTYLGGCQAVLLMYDPTSLLSFANLLVWLDAVKKTACARGGGGVVLPYLALVCCKSDLQEGRAVTEEDQQRLAQQLGMFSYFTSSLTGDGVMSTVYRVAADLMGLPLTTDELERLAGPARDGQNRDGPARDGQYRKASEEEGGVSGDSTPAGHVRAGCGVPSQATKGQTQRSLGPSKYHQLPTSGQSGHAAAAPYQSGARDHTAKCAILKRGPATSAPDMAALGAALGLSSYRSGAVPAVGVEGGAAQWRSPHHARDNAVQGGWQPAPLGFSRGWAGDKATVCKGGGAEVANEGASRGGDRECCVPAVLNGSPWAIAEQGVKASISEVALEGEPVKVPVKWRGTRGVSCCCWR